MSTKEYANADKMYAMAYAPTFADWLEVVLKEKGISQAELARRAGVTRGAITNIITGSRGPGVELCRGIAKALDIPVVQVLRAANLIDAEVNVDETIEQIIEAMGDFSLDERQEILAYINWRRNQRKKQ